MISTRRSTPRGYQPIEVPKGRIGALQGLRGLAVILVVISQTISSDSTTIALGTMGVTMFFTLSGFLITGVLADPSDEGLGRLCGFYGARAVRLLPALIVLVLVVGTIWVLGGRPV